MKAVFLFFRALELRTRIVLVQQLKTASKSRDSVIKEVMDDDDVQFLWSILSIDISDCDEASELLWSVTELWITIRGHSMTGSYMEQFKKENKMKTTKKKGLRKGLKKSKQASHAVDEAYEEEDCKNTE